MRQLEKLVSEILKTLGIDSETHAFVQFADMLLETNKVMNLTAITEPREVAIRHFADSLSLLNAYDFSGKRVIDVGCGAGFPGLPLKLGNPDISLTLLDSLAKRINFLEGVVSSLSLSGVECIHARAEEQAQIKGYREGFDIAVSRAVADLSMLSELCLPYVKTGGVFIAMKSTNCDEELLRAEKAIEILGGKLEERVDYPLHDTGITHSALIIRKVRATPAKYPRRFAKIKSNPL